MALFLCGRSVTLLLLLARAAWDGPLLFFSIFFSQVRPLVLAAGVPESSRRASDGRVGRRLRGDRRRALLRTGKHVRELGAPILTPVLGASCQNAFAKTSLLLRCRWCTACCSLSLLRFRFSFSLRARWLVFHGNNGFVTALSHYLSGVPLSLLLGVLSARAVFFFSLP